MRKHRMRKMLCVYVYIRIYSYAYTYVHMDPVSQPMTDINLTAREGITYMYYTGQPLFPVSSSPIRPLLASSKSTTRTYT